MTKIDAINKMLRYVGELPVPSSVVISELEEGHEAITAIEILEEISREVQEKGWWFNKENWELVPEVGGYILLPYSVIGFKPISSQDNYRRDGGNLYDINAKTKIFEANVELNMIFEVPFEDVPSVCATYIVYRASQELNTFLEGDDTVDKKLERNMNKSWIKLEREDMANSKFNLIRGSRVIDRTTIPTPLT